MLTLCSQLGLRNAVSGNTVSVPTEVVFGYGARCTSIRAGGALAFFQTTKSDGTGIDSVELFACGNGRFGSLGNGIFTSAQGSPRRSSSPNRRKQGTQLSHLTN